MIDLEKGQNQLDKADGFLTKLKEVLKKHWGILMILGLGGFMYWAFTLPPEELNDYSEDSQQEQVYQTPSKGHKGVVQHESTEESYYIVKEEYIIDPSGYRAGDTVYVDTYSDGYVEQYYTDGEAYYVD